jgi:hypothetical protein
MREQVSKYNDFRGYSSLPDLRLPIQENEDSDNRGRLFESWECIETENGDIIYVAPTCDVSVSALLPDNWSRTTSMSGPFRLVRSIDALKDGNTPHLVVKSPERIFTRDPQRLARGDIWWGGLRSLEKAVDMGIHPIVEAQVEREAIVLFALKEAGIPAEIPQAIISKTNGSSQLVVQEILPSYSRASEGISFSYSMRRSQALGFITDGTTGGYNCIRDRQGNDVFIGVNRWQIPPHTDPYQMDLEESVTEVANTLNAVEQ